MSTGGRLEAQALEGHRGFSGSHCGPAPTGPCAYPFPLLLHSESSGHALEPTNCLECTDVPPSAREAAPGPLCCERGLCCAQGLFLASGNCQRCHLGGGGAKYKLEQLSICETQGSRRLTRGEVPRPGPLFLTIFQVLSQSDISKENPFLIN